MSKKYYDAWEFLRANDYIDTDPLQANLKLKEYLERYPLDYATYSFYAGSFITLGQFDKAEEVLNYLEYATKNDIQFNTQKEKFEYFNKIFLFDKFRLLSYQGKYEELNKLCYKYRKQLQELNLNDLDFYCKKKLNRLPNLERENNTYLFRQMIDYKEEDLFEHLKKHLADYNTDLDKPNDSLFVPDFPLKEVIEEIKKYIPSDIRLCHGFYDDIYVFRYKECGRVNNKLVDYFKVSCFHDTCDIITIYPAPRCEKLPHVDISYLDKREEVKVTIISQREKFNKRYGLK